VFSVALQPDGRIVAGGAFTVLGGEGRHRIARLENTYPTSASLTFDGSKIVWTRSGAAPEFLAVRFALSTNGTQWSEAGVGSRSGDSWELGGLNFPVGTSVRARGFVAGGRYNCSTWFQEETIGSVVPEPPVIISQPASGTHYGGTTLALAVHADGAQPMSFQWYRDGTALTNAAGAWGATKATLTFSNVTAVASGQYQVVISNTWGSLTSVVAHIVVVDPFITSHPASVTTQAGGLVNLSATAGGSPPVSYRWLKDGVVLVDEGKYWTTTTTNLLITSGYGPESGAYTFMVSNAHGIVTSSVAQVTFTEPRFTLYPASQTVNPGATAQFTAGAVGTAPLLFQWRKDGVDLPDATNSSLTVTNVQLEDCGTYEMVATTPYGTGTSPAATLVLNLAMPDDFAPSIDGHAAAIALQKDHQVLLGGDFTTVNGEPRSGLARMSADGILDAGFNPGAWPPDVRTVAIQPDDRILVGGRFTSLAGHPRLNLGRLLPNGAIDPAFDPGVNDRITALLVRADDRILIGGDFTEVAGIARNRLALLNADGSIDPTFAANADGQVRCLAIQPDGRVLVGGEFAILNGQLRFYLGRLNTNGSLDTSFSAQLDRPVTCVALQRDGRILIGGDFYSVSSRLRFGLARLHSNGALDTSFNARISGSMIAVHSLVLQSDGKLIIGGRFSEVDGFPRTGLARLHADGTIDDSFHPPLAGEASALAQQSDGRLLVAGSFESVAGVPRDRIARLQSTHPPTELLALSGSGIQWQRAGTPEFWRVVFDSMTGEDQWMRLGDGVPDAQGWGLSGVTLATNSIVRARGFVAAGHNNGSGWFDERSTQADPRAAPGIPISGIDPNLHPFGFRVEALIGQVVVVEGSTNLVDWTPIRTNTAGDLPLHFTDPDSAGLPSRFYRARSH
jgi:uncharacterized delta-60 repeat protein